MSRFVEIGTINCGAVDNHILELAGDGYHAGAGRSKLEAEELGFIQFISPLERHDAVFVMARRAQALTIGDIVIFDDKPPPRDRDSFVGSNQLMTARICGSVGRSPKGR